MTRAERYAKRVREANARCPRVSFEAVTAYANEGGHLVLHDRVAQGYVHINADRIPAFVKFLKENFIRKDK